MVGIGSKSEADALAIAQYWAITFLFMLLLETNSIAQTTTSLAYQMRRGNLTNLFYSRRVLDQGLQYQI